MVEIEMAAPDGGSAGSGRGPHAAGGRPRRTWLALGAGVIALLALEGLLVAMQRVAPQLGAAQRATPTSFPMLRDTSGLRSGIAIDFAFIAAYTLLGLAAFSRVPRPTKWRWKWHPGAVAGAGLLLGAAAADVVEDVLLLVALGKHSPGGPDPWLSAMRGAGMVKWCLAAGTACAVIALVLTRRRSDYTLGRASARFPAVAEHEEGDEGATPLPHPWDPPMAGSDGKVTPRLGVCLSGGGIRSAAYSLGGLQALQQLGVLANAEYLAAASGGGYMAAGWAVADAAPNVGGVTPDAAWSRGSTEERWFRDHSSYLVPDLLGGAKGVGRLLGGVVVNFLVIWLLLFLVARPVGWVIAEAHRELRATEPVALPRDTVGEMRIGSIAETDTGEAVVEGAAVRARRFAVSLVPAPADPKDGVPRANEVCFDTKPFDPGDREHCFGVQEVPDRPAIVEVRAGLAEVVVQPEVRLDQRCAGARTAPSKRCDVYDLLSVETQPKVALVTTKIVGPPRPDQLEVRTQPRVEAKSGLFGRPHPSYKPWMWQGSVGLLAAAGLLSLWMVGRRLLEPTHAIARAAAVGLALAGVAWFLVTVALPALAGWLLEVGRNLPGSDSRLGDSLLPSGGLIGLVSVSAAHQYLTGSEKGTGARPAKPAGESSSIVGRARKALNDHREQLTWYEMSPLKITLFVVLVLGFVVSFTAQLQYAIANGWNGELMGLSFVRDNLPDWLFQPEIVKFLIVAGAMIAFAATADAHSWSLYPYYKRQLSSAYLLRRTNETARPIPFDELLPFTPLAPDWTGLPVSGGAGRPGPKLLLCCAVNLSEYGVVPPGRRAASFTFSAECIGGPLVGYKAAGEYWDQLPPERRRDITIPSAMAISGAAFSPAMGKTNLGAVGSLMALANLRLGVWLPHPQRVRPENAGRWGGLFRPGWTWFLREVCNSYRFQRRYLYVSDGGHWDNLGLVELLRRGCTEIICISAAGDGALSFGTIAEAVGLAREEVCVDITLDPTPLRPRATDPPSEPPPAPARELRRRGAMEKSAPFAPGSHAVGTYTWQTSTATGTILYIETAITDDLPFDVHGFAESETIFPDDATGDQVFNHRQFESFRALGYHQVTSALEP